MWIHLERGGRIVSTPEDRIDTHKTEQQGKQFAASLLASRRRITWSHWFVASRQRWMNSISADCLPTALYYIFTFESRALVRQHIPPSQPLQPLYNDKPILLQKSSPADYYIIEVHDGTTCIINLHHQIYSHSLNAL